MKDNGLQGIAADIQKNNRLPVLKIIGAIIFILPIVIHGFKWGWIYPTITLFTLGFLIEELRVFGVILWILLMTGSIWLCRRRVIIMRNRRNLANTPNLYAPSIMRDDD